MRTKHIITPIIFVAIFAQTAGAQTEKKLSIEHATVFLKGAELTSKATVKLPAGESEVIFTNVAGNINTQSLNVGTGNGVTVQSVVYQRNYLAEKKITRRALELEDSINYLTDERNEIYYDQQVADKQIFVLENNNDLYSEQTGVSTDDVKKMMDLIQARLKPLLKQRTMRTNELNKIDKRISAMNQQLNEEMQRDNKPGGIVIVKFFTRTATTTGVVITYVATDAGWAPSYDLRVNSINAPIDLTYKAHVRQNTGVTWDNINLSLSGGNPNEGTQPPGIMPWHLSLYRPQPLIDKHSGGASPTKIAGELEKMATRNTSSIVSTSAGAYNRSDGSLYYIDGVQVQAGSGINLSQNSLDKYMQVDVQGINTRFNIEIPYTIPSDNKIHNVSIKNYELPATYRYYTVPKRDKDVFLQAQITEWQKYNLLSGNTSIFFDNMYIGDGLLDTKNLSDTMYISLGRDKKIIVSRELDKTKTTVKTIKSNISKSYSYKIDVRNTRNEAIRITIVDQIPVSDDNNIDIEDIELSGAELDKTKGIATWKLDIEPNKTSQLNIGYTIKYPKDVHINNL